MKVWAGSDSAEQANKKGQKGGGGGRKEVVVVVVVVMVIGSPDMGCCDSAPKAQDLGPRT
jgi:hypothetical protein